MIDQMNPQTELSPKTESPKSHKPLIIGLIVLVAVLAAGIVYLLTKSDIGPHSIILVDDKNQDEQMIDDNSSLREVEGWQTYTSTVLGLTFKYPNELTIKETLQTGIDWYTVEFSGNSGLTGVISINNPGFGSSPLINNTPDKLDVDGIEASYFIGQGDPEIFGTARNPKVAIVAFSKGSDEYYIQFTSQTKDYDLGNFVEIFVSTFKFIN